MLPLAVLAGLIGAGLYISRRELAETLESPQPEKCRHAGGSAGLPYRPVRPEPTPKPGALEAPSKRVRTPLIPGPFGEGPAAHFSNRDTSEIKQSRGMMELFGGLPTEGVAPKSELPNFGVMHRQPRLGDVDRTRYEASQRKDGISPVDAQRSVPMSEDRARAAALPKDNDALRSAANPKLVAHGRMMAAPQRTTFPGIEGVTTTQPRRKVSTSTTFNSGMSAVRRGAGPGEHVMPLPTCRDGAPLPIPGAGRSLAPGGYSVDGNTLRYSNSELCTPAGGAAGGEKARKREGEIEMFEAAMCAPERGYLPEPPLGGARSSAMGSFGPAGAPSVHSMPSSDGGNRRTLMDKNARVYSGVQIASNPPKQTVHEPEPLRTTLRETATHDQGDGWLKGPETGVVRSPDLSARTTGRETLADIQGAHGDGRVAGSTSVYKPPVYDPNDIFDTTTRETTENNQHTGYVGSVQREGSNAPQPDLDLTQRSHTHAEYFGDAARPGADGYRVSEARAHGTNRQVASHTDYRGAAGPTRAPKMMSGDEVYARVFSDARETTLRRRSPTGRRETLAVGADSIATPTRSRDHFLDLQPERISYQDQGRTQMHIVPACVSDTRGGRRVQESAPDPAILGQLESNVYALHGPPV